MRHGHENQQGHRGTRRDHGAVRIRGVLGHPDSRLRGRRHRGGRDRRHRPADWTTPSGRSLSARHRRCVGHARVRALHERGDGAERNRQPRQTYTALAPPAGHPGGRHCFSGHLGVRGHYLVFFAIEESAACGARGGRSATASTSSSTACGATRSSSCPVPVPSPAISEGVAPTTARVSAMATRGPGGLVRHKEDRGDHPPRAAQEVQDALDH